MSPASSLGRPRVLACLALLVAGQLLAGAPAHAADPDRLGLAKVGEGTMQWFGISLYSASLWSTDREQPDPADEPVMLRITYDKNISRDRILNVTRKEWARLSVAGPAERARWLAELGRILPDVRRGDELASLVLPDGETRFYFGGREIGRVEEPGFGSAFLAIWLDPRTRAADLRAALLNAPS